MTKGIINDFADLPAVLTMKNVQNAWEFQDQRHMNWLIRRIPHRQFGRAYGSLKPLFLRWLEAQLGNRGVTM